MTLRRSLHAEVLQATASEGLAQGPYVAARARFEPAALRSKGIDSTISSFLAPLPPSLFHSFSHCLFLFPLSLFLCISLSLFA